MTVYAYKAADPTGGHTCGTLLADTPAEGRRQLRAQGLCVEQFAPAALRSSSAHFELASRRQACVAEFSRLVALLLLNGVTLREALDTLISQVGGSWKTVLRSVRGRLDAGAALAEALAEHPRWFPEIVLGAVRVGEQAGKLEMALDQVARYLEDHQVLANRVKTALVYPAILLCTCCGVVLFLMSYVIPQLLTVLEAGGQELPVSTRLLKSSSDLLLTWWPVLLLCTAMGIATFTAVLRTTRGRLVWHRSILACPLIGMLVRKTLISRFAQQMSMMLASEITFLEALGTVRRSTKNAVLAGELQAIEQAVEAGSDIAPTLANSRVFPRLVRQLIAVGQSSGELPTVLDQLRRGYETEVRLAVARFTAVLEPLLILTMAAVIGFIVFATLLPILQATRVMI